MKRYNFETMQWEDRNVTPKTKPKTKQVRKTTKRTAIKTRNVSTTKKSFKFEKSPQKDLINQTLARYGNRNGFAIVLDGPSIHTTKALLKQGWNKPNIIIPNFDKYDYDQIKKKHPTTLFKSLGTQVLGMGRRAVGLIYADYMCSFDGNDQCNPLRDINRIFENKIMMDNSIFAITISQRGHPKEKAAFVNADVQRCIWEVQKAAHVNGYTALLYKVGGSYKNGGAMWSGIFNINKK